MKKDVSGFRTGLGIAALLIVVSCFIGVQSAYAQVTGFILQSSSGGTTVRQIGQHMLSTQPMASGFLGQVDDCGPCGNGSGGGRAAWVNYTIPRQ